MIGTQLMEKLQKEIRNENNMDYMYNKFNNFWNVTKFIDISFKRR